MVAVQLPSSQRSDSDEPAHTGPAPSPESKRSLTIAVRSLWKVFGENAERAMSPEFAQRPKNEIQSELGCVVALHDVDFDVYEGETFVVMGLSGSGKSTLVRCLIRLIEPTSGEIQFFGDDIRKYGSQELLDFRRHKASMVFQHYGLLPHRSVLDNAAWGLEVQGVDRETRYAKAREVLDLVGLKGWEDRFPTELSGGMQQRVGIARALSVDPEVLLMDEPFSGLDPLIRREMQEELIRLQHDLHKTIVFITHDLDEALLLGDRIMIMRDGRVIQTGSPEEIVLNPEDEYVGEFTRDVRRESVLTAEHVMSPPHVVIRGYQGPRAALHAMRQADAPAAIVVDIDRNVLGVLTIEQAVQSAREGVEHVRDCVSEIPTVSPDTSFEELIPLGMSAEVLVPVTDARGRLLGEIHRADIAAVMRNESDSLNDSPSSDAAEHEPASDEVQTPASV